MEKNNIYKTNSKVIYDSLNNRFFKKYGLDSLLEYFTNEEKIKIINDKSFNQILKPEKGCAYYAIVNTKANEFDIVYCFDNYVMGNVKDTGDLVDLTTGHYDSSSIIIADITEIVELKLKAKKSADVVNHPSHYNYGEIEVIDYIKQVTNGYKKGHVAYCIGNVIKYVSRAPFKNGLEDLKKAAWYLNEAIEKYEK